MFQPFKDLYHWVDVQGHRIPAVPRNLGVTALFLCAAYWVSGILIGHTGGENNSALVFVLAVALISLLTSGYFYGIAASIIGALFINIYFMEPYDAFSLSRTGYPVAMLSMVAISCVVCALTARVKRQAVEADRREKNTKALYEMNEKLNTEKAAIQLESERISIRENILRAVSHDLRTPLTSISGAASVLLESPDISEKNVSMLSDIKQDADSLIVMVENLLSVTRVQDGTIPLKKREEMLEEVAGDALLTRAFEVMLSQSCPRISPVWAMKAASIIAFCAGMEGMIGGQMIGGIFSLLSTVLLILEAYITMKIYSKGEKKMLKKR